MPKQITAPERGIERGGKRPDTERVRQVLRGPVLARAYSDTLTDWYFDNATPAEQVRAAFIAGYQASQEPTLQRARALAEKAENRARRDDA